MASLRTIAGGVLAAMACCAWGCASNGTSAPWGMGPQSYSGARESDSVAPRLGTAFAEHATENFLIVHSQDSAWAAQMGDLLERIHDQFYQAFRQAGFDPQPVGSRLTWVCFGDWGDFDKYARSADQVDMSWVTAYYSAKTNRVAVVHLESSHQAQTHASLAPTDANSSAPAQAQAFVAGSQTAEVVQATHEAAHQLSFNSGLLSRRVQYPLWVAEGLATNFEYDPAAFGRSQHNPIRQPRLVEADVGGRLMPLERFVSLARVSADDNKAANELYGQAWGLFQFLFQTRPQQLREYLATLAKQGPSKRDESTMRREFIKAFGPIEPIEAEWRRFVDRLSFPVARTDD